jgi:murein DD-endopeptidase MepM/ murein hydrolase activator NlpD
VDRGGMLRQAFAWMLGVVLLLGCGRAPAGHTLASERAASTTSVPAATATATAIVTATLAATSTATTAATATATPTASPTPTATPTATALPVIVFGNPRWAISTTPMPQSGAPCGVVDTFDFPLNPPHAENIIRFSDYGVYRAYYGGYHTGEDWWGPGGRTFGLPVHSIGHGTVTYAAPLGWGTDKGTVVVRHALADGSTILSFYGHLDPSSVVLRAGDCVVRGQQVGRVGRPSSPPHLHFEIRTHMPNEPGPGYWPSDPTQAGWLSPSLYIWETRLAAAPGVQWTRPLAARGSRGVGMLDDDTFVAVEGDQWVGISVRDGRVRWRQTSSIRATEAILDASGLMVYAANRYTGRVEALRFAGSQGSSATTAPDSPLIPLWETRLGAAGSVTLMPLPGGGVAVSSRKGMIGLSAAGELLWEYGSAARAFDWLLHEEQLIFSTIGKGGSLWTADERGPVALPTPGGGYLVRVDDQIWVYAEQGIYRLDPKTFSAHLLYALPEGRLEQESMVALPGGGVLLTHADAYDRRLITLNADGTLGWQRSYARSAYGHEHRLVVLDGHPYLVSHQRVAALNKVSVFLVDVNRARLTQIFAITGRNPRPDDTWVSVAAHDRLLLSVGSGLGGGSIVALDVESALQAILQAASSD